MYIIIVNVIVIIIIKFQLMIEHGEELEAMHGQHRSTEHPPFPITVKLVVGVVWSKSGQAVGWAWSSGSQQQLCIAKSYLHSLVWPTGVSMYLCVCVPP